MVTKGYINLINYNNFLIEGGIRNGFSEQFVREHLNDYMDRNKTFSVIGFVYYLKDIEQNG